LLKYILIYGLALLGIVISLQFINYNLWLNRIDVQSYAALIALMFLLIGIFIARNYLVKSNTGAPSSIPGNSNVLQLNFEEALKLNISKRELEVLSLLSQGFTNQQIADQLFISLNTAKTHISNIYNKLDVSNRTQAISKAKQIGLLS
jgi:NarL family two-component system response regulator LiaR